MMKFSKITAAAVLLLSGAAACADLDVVNNNEPDRRRALATPGDVEALIAGSYQQWFLGQQAAGSDAGSPGLFLAAAAFQWSSTAANFGILQYSRIPRTPILNTTTNQEYGHFSNAWTRNYRALAAVAEGIGALEENEDLAEGLGAQGVLRARIFGKFVQGLAHGGLALLYDRAFVVDEDVATIDEAGAPVLLGEPVGYNAVMAAAIGYFDEAIALAGSAGAAGITIPQDWMATSAPVNMATLIQLANSFQASYRANVARTPNERNAVNWAAVLADVGAGRHASYSTDMSYAFNNWVGFGHLYYPGAPTFSQLTYFVHGMADQAGDYQRWLQVPVSSREALFNGTEPVLIVTPDLRFPRGTTVAEQQLAANRGRYIWNRAGQWNRPERGSWRWSWYFDIRLASNQFAVGEWPLIDYDEMRLLAAEALYRTGNRAAAADSVNVTRVGVGGLNATNADGLNTSCVPKLPNGTCGDLFEMLKWEKRLETWFTGPYQTTWYFDGRGWDDLYEGTPLQFPIPDEQIQVLQLGANYTFGGVGGTMAADGSTYDYPGEGD